MGATDVLAAVRARRVVAACAGLILGLVSQSATRDGVPVRVTVHEEIQPGHVTYRYAVTNNGDRPIAIVMIGVDPVSGEYVLTAVPLGWRPGRPLPHTSVGAPAGWTATVYSVEESDRFAIEWRTGPHEAILPRSTIRGFRVVLSRPDDLYKSSGWQATDTLSGTTSGRLEPVPSRR